MELNKIQITKILSYAFIGWFFMCFNLYLGIINILPSILGYGLLIYVNCTIEENDGKKNKETIIGIIAMAINGLDLLKITFFAGTMSGYLISIVGTIISIIFCIIVLDNLAKLDSVNTNKMFEFKKWLIGLRTTFLIASIISLNFSEIDIVILFSSVLGSFLNIAILVELYKTKRSLNMNCLANEKSV